MKKGTRNIREKLNLTEEEDKPVVNEESKIDVKVGLDDLNGGVFSYALLLSRNVRKVKKHFDKISFFANFNSSQAPPFQYFPVCCSNCYRIPDSIAIGAKIDSECVNIIITDLKGIIGIYSPRFLILARQCTEFPRCSGLYKLH